MTQRISISLPDSLFDRLQPHKFNINISKICQKTIEKELSKKEDFERRINESPDMADIIERLRGERRDFRPQVEELGITDGIEWAKIAHYDDLEFAAHDGFGDYPFGNMGDQIDAYIEKKMELSITPSQHSIEDEDLNSEETDDEEGDGLWSYLDLMIPNFYCSGFDSAEFTVLYYYSFYEGVQKFWYLIKDKL